MIRRIYCLMPDVKHTKQVFNELLLARVADHNIHILSKDESHMGDLPRASLFQKTDIAHAAELGLVVGAITGFFAGLVATYAFSGSLSDGGIVLGTMLFGAVFGVWSSSMIGVSAPNTRLKRFNKALNNGELLMMIDVPKDRVKEITYLIEGKYPEAHDMKTELSIPVFP